MSQSAYNLVSISRGGRAIYADATNGGMASHISNIEKAYSQLVEGGFVIDKRPIEDHPDFPTWVVYAPSAGTTLRGDGVKHFSAEDRKAAGEMAPMLGGAFAQLATLAALGVDAQEEGEPGMFDTVTVETLAKYWAKRGARIGIRQENNIVWQDGTSRPIDLEKAAQERMCYWPEDLPAAVPTTTMTH